MVVELMTSAETEKMLHSIARFVLRRDAKRSGVTLDDLLQAGRVTLLQLAHRWKEREDKTFQQYAFRAVRASMMRELFRSKPVRLPYYRKESGEFASPDNITFCSDDTLLSRPTDNSSQLITALYIRGAVAKLTYQQQTVIKMLFGIEPYEFQYTYEEAGAVLGVTKQTAQVHYQNGIKRLERLLNENF